MRTFSITRAALMALALVLQCGIVAAADVGSAAISGTYQLSRADDPNGAAFTMMQIIGSSGTGFFVQGVGQSWSGSGSFANGAGAYDWKLADGRSGRTTISVDSDGNLRGHVAGSGIDWQYIARRQEGPIVLSMAAAAAGPVAGCGVFTGPYPDGPLSYFNVTNTCAAAQDCWVWVNKPSGPKYQQLVEPGAGQRIDVGVLHDGDGIEKSCKAR